MNDLGFWLGLALSIPLSILGNILTPKLVAYLERRKVVKTTRSRRQETMVYERTRAFKNGTRDRYPFYFLCATSSVLCAIAASTLIALLLLLPLGLDIRVAGWALAMALAFLSLTLLLGIHITAYNLKNFADYERRFKERWPD
jgi:hypothetical protein